VKSLIHIKPDGSIVAVKTVAVDEVLSGFVHYSDFRRASHILPCNLAKRIAFQLFRLLFGERGQIADWCRNWRGPWQVTWAENLHQIVFKHSSRKACIKWEIAELNKKLSQTK
jgi:hypothetical protein